MRNSLFSSLSILLASALLAGSACSLKINVPPGQVLCKADTDCPSGAVCEAISQDAAPITVSVCCLKPGCTAHLSDETVMNAAIAAGYRQDASSSETSVAAEVSISAEVGIAADALVGPEAEISWDSGVGPEAQTSPDGVVGPDEQAAAATTARNTREGLHGLRRCASILSLRQARRGGHERPRSARRSSPPRESTSYHGTGHQSEPRKSDAVPPSLVALRPARQVRLPVQTGNGSATDPRTVRSIQLVARADGRGYGRQRVHLSLSSRAAAHARPPRGHSVLIRRPTKHSVCPRPRAARSPRARLSPDS